MTQNITHDREFRSYISDTVEPAGPAASSRSQFVTNGGPIERSGLLDNHVVFPEDVVNI